MEKLFESTDYALAQKWAIEIAGDPNQAQLIIPEDRFIKAVRNSNSVSLTTMDEKLFGLGLGVIPYAVQDFCSVVDVVELQPDVISCVNQLGHLKSNVSLIQGEISAYEPTGKYDVILLDIWYTDITEELTDQLIEKYSPHLNAGGFLYIPINAGSIEDKVKIYNDN